MRQGIEDEVLGRTRNVLDILEDLGFGSPGCLLWAARKFLENILFRQDRQPFLSGIDRERQLAVVVQLELTRDRDLLALGRLFDTVRQAQLCIGQDGEELRGISFGGVGTVRRYQPASKDSSGDK